MSLFPDLSKYVGRPYALPVTLRPVLAEYERTVDLISRLAPHLMRRPNLNLVGEFDLTPGTVDSVPREEADRLVDIIIRASRIAESERAEMTLSVLMEVDR